MTAPTDPSSPLTATGEPYIFPIPGALRTGIIISSSREISQENQTSIKNFIHSFEGVLSRFLPQSLVSHLSDPGFLDRNGGIITFPDYLSPLFTICDDLYTATDGAFDPCVGEDLVRLGYSQSFELIKAEEPIKIYADLSGEGSTRGKTPGERNPEGRNPKERKKRKKIHRLQWESLRQAGPGSTLTVSQPVTVDFGAVGKGFLVDVIADKLLSTNCGSFTINAGGDLYFSHAGAAKAFSKTLPANRAFCPDGESQAAANQVALEDPEDSKKALGIVTVDRSHEFGCSLCASSTSRRHWLVEDQKQSVIRMNHIVNAINAAAADNVIATWALVENQQFSTAWADGVATALFLCNPQKLYAKLPHLEFEFFQFFTDRSAAFSPGFPATIMDMAPGAKKYQPDQTRNGQPDSIGSQKEGQVDRCEKNDCQGI